jgi:hypothetical protein
MTPPATANGGDALELAVRAGSVARPVHETTRSAAEQATACTRLWIGMSPADPALVYEARSWVSFPKTSLFRANGRTLVVVHVGETTSTQPVDPGDSNPRPLGCQAYQAKRCADLGVCRPTTSGSGEVIG